MLPNLDPRQMKNMMRQMGMSSEEIEALRVVVECRSGEKLVFENPQITKISMQGNTSFQLVGNYTTNEKVNGISSDTDKSSENSVEILEEDVEMVSNNSNVTKERAREELEKVGGDIAKAITNLGA